MGEKKEKNIVPVLIRKFYENDLPPEIQFRFRSWYIDSEATYEKKAVAEELWDKENSGQNLLTQQELKKVKRRIHQYEKRVGNKKNFWFMRAAVIILLPLLGFLSASLLKKETVLFIEPELVEYVVPYGEREHIILPDGSEVWLNAGSFMIYEKGFAGTIRSVYLNGEANFSVTSDPDKPFIVKTAYIDVEALGTVFNVQSYADAEISTATLEEGIVRVNPKQEDIAPVILSPNQQLIYNRTSKTFTTQLANAAKLSQWKKGFIVFQNSSFDFIVKSLERQFNVRINYKSEKYAERNFTIKFSPDESLDEVLNILKDLVHFKYKKEDGTIYIL